MICCLNPDCNSPENPDLQDSCVTCGQPLILLLRGRYRVIQLLASDGGFGRIYLAEDTDKMNEYCVVKQLAPKFQGTLALHKAMQLFDDEAKQLQKLEENPQIPTLLAYFEQDKYLYLVQQYIYGQNLLQELEQRCSTTQSSPYSETEIYDILLDLLPILQFIHDRGVIHRDIKPQNTMRRQNDGKLVLIDFGISKQLTATVQTQMGTIIGTRGYGPIEQLQGGEAYPASDLFSLGATCFQLLTGVSPVLLWAEYGYSWVTSWRQHLKSPISPKLAKVLDKLLQKDIQERYQSASEVIQDLRSQVTPPPPKLNNLRKAILAGVAIMLLGGGGLYWGISHPPTVATSNNPVKTITGHANLVTAIAITPDGKTLASASLDTTVKLWNLATKKYVTTFEGNSGSLYAIAISQDGNTLVSGTGQNTIKLWNIHSKQERTLKGHSQAVKSVAVSPDGKILASGGFDGIIKLWDLASGQELPTLQGHTQEVKSIAISPDGQTLASGSADNTIKLWNLADGKLLNTLNGHAKPINAVIITPDGQTVASGSADNTIKLWNLTDGKLRNTFQGHSFPVTSLAISVDSKTLASGSADNTIKLWNPANGKLISTLQGHSKEVTSVAMTPDSKTIVSGSVDGTIKIWQLSP